MKGTSTPARRSRMNGTPVRKGFTPKRVRAKGVFAFFDTPKPEWMNPVERGMYCSHLRRGAPGTWLRFYDDRTKPEKAHHSPEAFNHFKGMIE